MRSKATDVAGTNGAIVRCSGASRATPRLGHTSQAGTQSGWGSGVGVVEEQCSLR